MDLKEKFTAISENILIHEARRKRTKEFAKKIEDALTIEEQRNHTHHIFSANYNRIAFGFIRGSQEYFFEEVIMGDDLSRYPYRERFETKKGEIIHTKLRTDGQNLLPEGILGVSRADFKRIDANLQNIRDGLFR